MTPTESEKPESEKTVASTSSHIANRCVQSMYEKDYLSKHMGMEILDVSAGFACVRMEIKQWMLNGFGSCHGGCIFSLADSAFAFACNSHNKANVAMDCRIDFLKPAFEGDVLVANANEVHCGKTSGLYQILIENQDKRTIAQFSGRSFYVNQPVFTED